jgi:hypothetical protein
MIFAGPDFVNALLLLTVFSGMVVNHNAADIGENQRISPDLF